MPDLGALIAEHQDALFAFLMRMTGDAHVAEDLMQETFVRALRASARYRPEAGLRTWLFSIASNLVRDRWRREILRRAVPWDDTVAPPDPAPDEAVLRQAGNRQVRLALLKLPPEQRAALVLRYFHDLSYQEIAAVLVCPVGTVRSRIHNGLARLKQLLLPEVSVHEGD